MFYKICSKCKGRCDSGEMIGGICLECLEEIKQEQTRAESVAKIMNSPSYQMELRLEEMKV